MPKRSIARVALRAVLGLVVLVGLVVAWFFATQPSDVSKLARLDAMYLKLPERYFAGRLENPPATSQGHVLNPKLQYGFEWAAREGGSAPLYAAWKTPEGRTAVRAAIDEGWTFRALITAPMASVEDRQIPGPGGPLAVRVYRPKTDRTGPLPILVYFHGGAFVLGSVNAVDRFVRVIANEADAIVVSVDYRLAPEHPYPAANEDAIAAYGWAVAQAKALGGAPDRVAVGGDSAGGYLSVIVSQHQLETGGPLPQYQLLYYPAVDFGMDYPSATEFATGYSLDRPLIDWALANTFPHGMDRRDILMRLVDLPTLGRMPPTLVAVAGFDPIRDSGLLFARRMKAAGGRVELHVYPTLPHNFLEFTGIAADARSAALETALAYGRAAWAAR